MRITTPSRAQQACFLGGVLVIAIALLSPLERVSGELFAAHMAQHLLLGLVAPLLLVIGSPLVPSSPRWGSAGVGVAAVALHAATFWLWHVPALYEGAVRHVALHAIEHLTLLAGGVALWVVVRVALQRGANGLAILWLFLSGMASGALAALLTLTPHALYEVHAAGTAAWGTTPLDDQRLAGAVMWLPGGLVYTVAAIAVLLRWLDQEPRRSPVVAARIRGAA